MAEDLGLTGTQYNTVLSIFFVTYVLFGTEVEVPLQSPTANPKAQRYHPTGLLKATSVTAHRSGWE